MRVSCFLLGKIRLHCPYLNEILLSFEKRHDRVKYFGEKMTIVWFVGKLMKGFDQSGVVGRSSTEKNLAFAEETFDARVMRE